MSYINDAIRKALAAEGRLPVDVAALADDTDLYRAGLTSHASVNVMLALEDELDLEFPDELLQRATFRSIDSLTTALDALALPAEAV